ncbi:uncharacterized protein LOC144637307 [Oculina patagonica]
MVKLHNCLVKIDNGTTSDMKYVVDWYDSGRLADGFSWPEIINPGQQSTVLNYEKDWSPAGCSGYVTYNMLDTDITIAFSNPDVGHNKLGVGTGGKSVWDNMVDHDYKRFTVNIESSDGETMMQFHCQCTSGETNTCTVDVTLFTGEN